uniref:EamA domain-containing protein n=1 Tax=Setaria digitata TaxID=48799 RepID=A0A915PV79_9BILA
MNETVVGFTSCIISSIAFGFMFVPLRNFNCNDGNIASVPIVNHLGIGVGMLVLVGWGVARFGFFGTRPQLVYNTTMNTFGLFFVLLSGFMFVFVKHKNQQRQSQTISKSPTTAADDSISMQQLRENLPQTQIHSKSYKPTFHMTKTKIGCLGLSVLLGILHGLMMTPIVYIQDNDPSASPDVLDYVFPHFSAIFACSTVYFIAYCLWMRHRTYAPAELLPSTIGVLADVLLFKDVKGKKNLFVTFSAVTIGLIGVLLIAFSNQETISFG